MTIIGSLLIALVSSFTAAQAQPEGLTWSFRQSAVRNSRTVTFSSTAEAGLRRSFDGGKTWEQASVGLTGPVVVIAAAPSAPAVFYSGTETTDFIILNESTFVAPVRLTLTSTPM